MQVIRSFLWQGSLRGEKAQEVKSRGGRPARSRSIDNVQGYQRQTRKPWTRSRGKAPCPGKPLPRKESCGRSMQGHSTVSLPNCIAPSVTSSSASPPHLLVVQSLGCFRLLQPHRLESTKLLCSWDFPGKTTGMGCHFLLQEIFQTQGSNMGLLHCRQILYHLNYQERSVSALSKEGGDFFQ